MSSEGPPVGETGGRSEWSAEERLFDRQLQAFAHRVELIVALETGGKLTADEAYQQIQRLWKALKDSRNHLP